jgi:hypothetical protein
MRDVDAGLTTMQADPGTARTSLDAMTDCSHIRIWRFICKHRW